MEGGGPGQTSAGEGDLWHLVGSSLADENSPFSLLDPAAGPRCTGPARSEPAESVDILELLMYEAESVLQDPNYVSMHTATVAALHEPAPTGSGPDPRPSREPTGHDKRSLLELLEGPASISGLSEPLDDLDGLALFAAAPAPDVLRLFAGGIVPTRVRDVASPLSRREHHLVSMDSAYRPAPAQAPGHDA
ncbi:hypothetical protein BKK79_02910 [Cupriavidus sp. USMAA2-4]|uniref:TagK domain-containing protein n=2 Tax=Burkholderiaceae TaxID=119060 RepID=A0ABM6F4A8_9BURK|nr:hypothetical protein BKK79_02910 [Cupriavidus sp. USMAA2-4]AOZ06163.1 hypothetical protein BKK80_10200 [Cupriavidus malaysiensis]